MLVQIISTAIGLIGVFIAFFSFAHRLTKSRREEQEALVARVKKLIHNELARYSSETSERLEAMNERFSSDVSRLYDRVGQLEGKTFTALLDRLATMEGELKIIADIIRMGKGPQNAK